MAGEAVSVKSGPDALEYLNQCTNDDGKAIPDLVLLDINMPYMDGWEFLEKFKELQPNFSNSPLIVMLSSSVYEADSEKAHANPEVWDYITKPLTIDVFQNLVERLF